MDKLSPSPRIIWLAESAGVETVYREAPNEFILRTYDTVTSFIDTASYERLAEELRFLREVRRAAWRVVHRLEEEPKYFERTAPNGDLWEIRHLEDVLTAHLLQYGEPPVK